MRPSASTAPSSKAAARARVLIISRHDYRTARRASVHFIARQMAQQGHDVGFLSIGYSWISRLRGDSRANLFHRANIWEEVDGLHAYLWRGTWHPVNLPVLNGVESWLYSLWANTPCPALDDAAREAEIIIVESGIGPALINRIRAAAPSAKLIYRATDLLSTAGVPDCIEDMLWQSEAHIDLIVVVARSMLPHFEEFGCPKIFIPHGVDTALLRRTTENPYATTRNAVTVGSMLFDPTAIRALAKARPDFTFHTIGSPKSNLPANVVQHDEMPFAQTLPYLQHADVGIAAYQPAAASAYLADSSLKLLQYQAIGLPSICPDFAVGDHSLRFGYHPGDAADIIRAFDQALAANRWPMPAKDWSDVAEELIRASLG